MRAVTTLNKSLSGVRFASSSLHAARRLKDRRGWLPAHADEESGGFLDESVGNDFNLNWAIAGYNMTASGKAFHNLHLRGLTMYTTGALDANKAVERVVGADASDKLVHVGKDLADGQFGQIVRRAREELSNSDAIFMHDGGLGLSKASGPTVRSFCGTAEGGLLLHNLLRSFRLPLSDDTDTSAWRQSLPSELSDEEVASQVRLGTIESPVAGDPHTLTQFLVPALPQAGPGLESGSFSVVDVGRRIIVHAGDNVNESAVRAGLLTVASGAGVWPEGTHVLEADAFLQADGAPVLVFGGSGAGALPWSAHQTLWCADGSVVPVWHSSAVEGAETRFGDIVEVRGSQKRVLGCRRSASEAFSASSPAALLFVDSSAKKATRINPEQARKLGLPGDLVDKVAKVNLVAVPPRGAKTTIDKWISSAVGAKK